MSFPFPFIGNLALWKKNLIAASAGNSHDCFIMRRAIGFAANAAGQVQDAEHDPNAKSKKMDEAEDRQTGYFYEILSQHSLYEKPESGISSAIR